MTTKLKRGDLVIIPGKSPLYGTVAIPEVYGRDRITDLGSIDKPEACVYPHDGHDPWPVWIEVDKVVPSASAMDWKSEAERMSIELHKARGQDVPGVDFFSLALAGEAGEVCNVVKKMVRDGHSAELTEKLAGELADVRIYLHHFVNAGNKACLRPGETIPELEDRTAGSATEATELPELALELFECVSWLISGYAQYAQRTADALNAMAWLISRDLNAEVWVKIAELYARWPETRRPEYK